MDWMHTIGDFWLTTLAWLVGLTVGFGLLVRWMPCNPGMYWWTHLRAVVTDGFYWLIVPLLLRLCRTAMLIGGVALFFSGREPDLLPVKQLQLWQQCLAILLIQDVMLYWIHRLFHTRWAWQFHAIHHSPTVLDWMSAARFHPINNLLSFALADVTVLLLGFPWQALVALVPFNTIYSAMVHANLNWTFGPLRYVFASPVFHRWHHTTEEEGLNKNFASTFPFLDVLFGTFYMPVGEMPVEFGNGEPDFPQGFWGQFIHPFRTPDAPFDESIELQPTVALVRPQRRGRSLVPAVKALGVLVLLAGFGFGIDYLTRVTEQNKILLKETTEAKTQACRSEMAKHTLQVELIMRAWADNDLVRATAVLADIAPAFQQTWEQQYLRDLCRQKGQVLRGHKGAVRSVALSADSLRLVSGGEDGVVKVWNAATGEETLTFTEPTKAVTSVALSADGKHIVAGGQDGTVRVWDATTSDLLTCTGHTAPVLSVAVSADGQRVVSGAADGTARVWNTGWSQQEQTLGGHTGAVLGVALSADGSRVVSAHWALAKVWDVESERETTVLKGHSDLVTSVAVSVDGKRIITGSEDGTARIWDPSGKQAIVCAGHKAAIASVAVSANGQRVVTGSKDRTVKVWDSSGHLEFTLRGHTEAVTSVAISANGQRIASASRDGTITLWNAEKCRP
jgi:WD40 repeat protein/sterol desaturase/sphingolipid hydroxylase (fatty acid hydroxylase superfamily)